MQKILLVGLGNPGMDATRHNIGVKALQTWFEAVRRLPEVMYANDWREDKKALAEVAMIGIEGCEIIGLFPLTYMNDSGKSLQEWLRHMPITTEDMLIIHDELELPLGEVRLDAEGGSARGHNGVRSIHTILGSSTMPRLRLGIGRPTNSMPVDQFVLAKFTAEEARAVTAMLAKASEAISEFTVQRRSQQ